MRAAQRNLLSALLLIPMFGSLLGCTRQQWWDDYVSKTETMKFLTFIPCDTFFVHTLPEHQVYFHVTGISRDANGSYRVEYQQQSEWVFEKIYFRSVLYIGLRDYTAIATVWMPSTASAKCAALVVLPWSSVWQRPFSYPGKSSSRAEAEQRLEGSAVVDCCVFVPLALLFLCGLGGFSEIERDELVVFLLFSTAVVLLNVGVLWFNALALTNIDALTCFYEFYDALPRIGERLLPLQWSQAHRIFDGPPHPASLVIDDRLSWMVLWASCGAWFVGYARRVFIGIAYATMADAFEELRARLLAEGRVPTPEDYMSVLMQAGATMNTWQLELLKRQMKVRLPDA